MTAASAAPQTGHQNFGAGGGRDPMDGFCNVYLIKWRQRQGDGKGIIDWRLPQDWQFTIYILTFVIHNKVLYF